MGRDGQIVVDDREDDVMDDELDDDSDDGDDDEQEDGGDELSRLRAEMDQLRQSNAKLEAATKRNNAELSRSRKLRAAMKRHGIDDLDSWAEQVKAGALTPEQAAELAGGAFEGPDEGSGSHEETPEAPATGVKTPLTDVDAEVARRVALEIEKREAQDGERVSLLEDELRTSRIEALLVNAKFSGTLEKALRVLDMDSITVDEDAKVHGAEDAVEALKKEIPEWFRAVEPAARAPRARGSREVDGGDRPRPPAKALTWDQRVAATLNR